MSTELRELTRSLRSSAQQAPKDVHAVVKKAAVNVKRDWRANARRSSGRHARAYPYSIGFDISELGAPFVTAVVGPDKDKKQGALGNLLEFGSAHSPPHNDGGRAIRAEEPRFSKAMRDLKLGL